jgi:hypothetical protein
MGGLLAADITLLFHHHIVGVINFDVPFLGMHPGIVKAGLTSIFKPWPTPEEQGVADAQGKKPSRMDTLFNPKPSDPYYNASFYNDVHLPVRKGWENALHFMNKHSNGLIQASKGLVKSHLEFGGAMADYRELKVRYARVRALEVDDAAKRQAANPDVRSPPRIRFVNYYTASTGRPKKPKSPKSPKSPSPSRPSSRGPDHLSASTSRLASQSQTTLNTQLPESTKTISPRISVEEHRGKEVVPVTPQEPPSATSPVEQHSLREISPQPELQPHDVPEIPETQSEPPNMPEIPPIPQEPPFVDIAQFTDKAERRAAEKEHTRALKEYQQKVKTRNKVIKERSKMQEKWDKEKEKQKQAEITASSSVPDHKASSGHESDALDEGIGALHLGESSHVQDTRGGPYANYNFSRSAILAQPDPEAMSDSTAPSTHYADSTHTLTTTDTNASTATDPDKPPKKQRFKKFCMLPPKDAYGNKDPAWVRVFMEGVDEVTAHTTLFFVSDTYERLVGDVGARIEDWIRESESLRLVMDLEGQYRGKY